MTKEQIKDPLVAEYGPEVLATESEGFDLAAWLVPGAAIVIAAVAISIGLRRWRRDGGGRDGGSAEPPEPGLDPEEWKAPGRRSGAVQAVVDRSRVNSLFAPRVAECCGRYVFPPLISGFWVTTRFGIAAVSVLPVDPVLTRRGGRWWFVWSLLLAQRRPPRDNLRAELGPRYSADRLVRPDLYEVAVRRSLYGSVRFSCGGPRYGNSGSRSSCGPTPSSVTFPFVKMAVMESPTSSVSARPLSG